MESLQLKFVEIYSFIKVNIPCKSRCYFLYKFTPGYLTFSFSVVFDIVSVGILVRHLKQKNI